MTQAFRLPEGGRIDRKRPLEFVFAGQRYQGYRGDTLASALLANGVRVVGRSFKYHRPRGIIGAGAEEPNAILQVGRGGRTLPGIRATQAELYDGLEAYNITAWPNLKFDLKAAYGAFGKLLPAGFYYKTFMWPARLWHSYERYIRNSAGLGRAPTAPDVDHYEHCNAHCDLLIAGAGPAGLAAALAAGRAGARVILVDEQNELGGSLLASRETIDGQPASEWVAAARRELATLAEVTLLARATVFGYYDHNFLGVLERVTDHLAPAAGTGPRQRLWRVRARRVVLATGAIERPLVFGNNDRPGVMLASAVSTYVNRYAVKPGQRALLFTTNDGAYRTALDLLDAGVGLAGVVDPRPKPGPLADSVRDRGIEVMTGHVVVDVQGGQRMDGARVMAFDGSRVHGPINGIDCDVVAVSGGWSPAVHLHSHTGGRNRWDDAKACFVPDSHGQGARSIGACNGTYALADCLREGYRAGAEAALALGFAGGGDLPDHRVATVEQTPPLPLWLVPGPQPAGHGPKQFVDYQNDTTAADIRLAVREGYRSVEHVKRYTALGFGTDQGKLGNINGMAILADALGQTIPETGTTTFRPAYTPVTFGAVAGRNLGPVLFDPVRKTAMHGWHEQHGAKFEDVGQWKRPWYYPRAGETMRAAVERECLAVRNGVGVLDASTLGKIDIQGPDAAAFLNLVYTNGWTKLGVGRCRYGLMLKEDGMVFDDGVTSRLAENHFLMTTSTGNAAAVLAWLERWLQTEWPQMKVHLTSVTDHWATVAVVGPNSRKVVGKLSDDIDFGGQAFPFMSFKEGTVAGVGARVFRISFTGELSFEINVPAHYGRHVWEAVMAAGEEFDITPYGTETMHVLRAEKGFIIVGQETDGSVTPVDLGMNWIIGNKEFIGKRSLARSDTVREDRKQLVGLKTSNGKTVLQEGGQIIEMPDTRSTPVPMLGHVTSSYWSAALQQPIALALVRSGHRRSGQVVYVAATDGSVTAAEIVSPVFYDPEGARQNV